MENLKILLRCMGHKTVFQDENGNYISKDSFPSQIKNCTEYTVESRLKLELYGEFPLNDKDEFDFNNNIRPGLRL